MVIIKEIKHSIKKSTPIINNPATKLLAGTKCYLFERVVEFLPKLLERCATRVRLSNPYKVF